VGFRRGTARRHCTVAGGFRTASSVNVIAVNVIVVFVYRYTTLKERQKEKVKRHRQLADVSMIASSTEVDSYHPTLCAYKEL